MVKVDIVRAIQLETNLQFGEAEKLVNDMLEMIKDKLETIQFENNILGSSSSNISEDALEALTALGYSRNEASRALVAVDSDTISEVEEKIRKALVYLNSL